MMKCKYNPSRCFGRLTYWLQFLYPCSHTLCHVTLQFLPLEAGLLRLSMSFPVASGMWGKWPRARCSLVFKRHFCFQLPSCTAASVMRRECCVQPRGPRRGRRDTWSRSGRTLSLDQLTPSRCTNNSKWSWLRATGFWSCQAALLWQ